MAPTGNQLPMLTCNLINTLLDCNWPIQQIAEQAGVHRSTVHVIRTNFEVFGRPYPPPLTKMGRPRALTTAQEDWIELFLEENPTAYLDEVALAVWDVFEIDVSLATVWNVLRRRNWSRKKVRAFAAQRSDELRAQWRLDTAEWRLDQLCFVDECAGNERTGYRRMGWSPKGMSCFELRLLSRADRWSILPALTVNGYLDDPLILQGAVTKEAFEWWLIHVVIPQLNPGMIIIMDNASIHRNLSQEVMDLLLERGVQKAMLPPYSPDFNPIENTFNTLKAWIRRNFWRQQFFPGDFRSFLELAIREGVGRDMRAYFRACHYGL